MASSSARGSRPVGRPPKDAAGAARWAQSLAPDQQLQFKRWIGAAQQAPSQGRGAAAGSAAWAKGLQGQDKVRFDDWTKAANRWIMPNGPSMQEQLSWQSRRDAANQALKQALAQYEFGQGQVEDQFVGSRQDVDREFGRIRERVPYSANERGVMTSGLYRDDLEEVAGGRVRALRDLLGDRQGALSGLELQRQQAEEVRARALAQLGQEEALRRFLLATQVGG